MSTYYWVDTATSSTSYWNPISDSKNIKEEPVVKKKEVQNVEPVFFNPEELDLYDKGG